jgi:hypothetical protein
LWALDAPVKWSPEGTMKYFMHALITLVPQGNRWCEGKKLCIRKMVGGKSGKFVKQESTKIKLVTAKFFFASMKGLSPRMFSFFPL